jgi:hypothetical protein
MKKLNELNLISITMIQLLIATIISLLFQFVIPMNWQLLYLFGTNPNIHHFDVGANIVIFTVSQWYFSLSIAWFINRDNPYINTFMFYSLVGLFLTIVTEIFSYGLFYDYYHIVPFIVSIYIIWKKRETLFPKWVIPNSIFITVWLLLVYFLRLAYFQAPLSEYLVKWVITILLGYVFAFILKIVKKRDAK